MDESTVENGGFLALPENYFQSYVGEHLDEGFADPPVGHTELYLKQVEAEVLELVTQHLFARLEQYATEHDLQWRRLGHDGFQLDEVRYVLIQSVSEGVLLLRIRNVDEPSMPDPAFDQETEIPVETSILDTNGRIGKIELFCGPRLHSLAPELISCSRGVLEAGYRWMEEEVRGAFSSLSDRLAGRLYRVLRKRIRPELAELIWLAIHVDQTTHYLVDTRGQQLILSRARERIEWLPYSPLEILTEVQMTSVKFDLTHSRLAVESGERVPQTLAEAKYPNMKLQIAEETVYDAGIVHVQPLIREGKALLTGTYPPQIEGQVRPALLKLRKSFQRIVEEESSQLKILTRKLRDQTVLPNVAGQVSYVAGEFLRGILDLPG